MNNIDLNDLLMNALISFIYYNVQIFAAHIQN